MSDREAPTARDLEWVALAPGESPIPIQDDLEAWHFHRRRPGRANARAVIDSVPYQLKWFDHPPGAQSPARLEYDNARAVAALDIPTVEPIGWGTHAGGSFLVMRESPGVPLYHLETRPGRTQSLQLADRFARQIARLHDAGLCHRDLYLDHLLIDGDRWTLIDLGRLMRFRRRRWILKDLGALLFSARREGVSAEACRRFLASYRAATRRRWTTRSVLRALDRRARRYAQHNRHEDLAGRRTGKEEAP